MKDFFKRIHTDNFRWYDFSLISLVLAYFFLEIGNIFGAIITLSIEGFAANIVPTISIQDPFVYMLVIYFAPIGVWILTLVFMGIFKPDRPIFDKIGTKEPSNNIKMLLVGLVIGFVMNMSCAVAAMINKDIAIYFNAIYPIKDIVLFIAVFVQSSAEELVCRGFLYNRLRRGYRHPAVAIIGNSVLFGLIHIFNPGVTVLAIISIILVGIFCSLIVYYYDSLWCVMMFHAAWNYTQNVLLGLPNSGLVFDFSIFKLDAASARDSFVYSVDFGVEATGFCIIVELIAIAVVWYLGYNKKKRSLELS